MSEPPSVRFELTAIRSTKFGEYNVSVSDMIRPDSFPLFFLRVSLIKIMLLMWLRLLRSYVLTSLPLLHGIMLVTIQERSDPETAGYYKPLHVL